MYAGAIFTVAEVLGGGLNTVLAPNTHYPLVAAVTIEFLAPGRTDLTARLTLTDDELAEVQAKVAAGEKVRMELAAEVLGTDGTLVARTRGQYQLRPLGS